jgi:hypothetical protein
VVDHVQGCFGQPVAGLRAQFHLGGPDFYNSKFGGYEKSIQ